MRFASGVLAESAVVTLNHVAFVLELRHSVDDDAGATAGCCSAGCCSRCRGSSGTGFGAAPWDDEDEDEDDDDGDDRTPCDEGAWCPAEVGAARADSWGSGR